MKRFYAMLAAAVLMMTGLSGCFPDDYLDETKKPEVEVPDPDDEKDPTPGPEDNTPLELNVVGR